MSARGREHFWKRWKTFAHVTRLRISGTTQLLPTDYVARCDGFTERLKASNHQRGGYKVVVMGDETPVIWEPVTSVTYDNRGSKRVKVKTTGKEKTMTTAWFAARAQRDASTGDAWDIQHLKPHMIWQAKSQIGPISKEAKEAGDKHGCTSATTPHGWTTGQSFLDWCRLEFSDAEKYPPGKTLFVMDLYAAHRTDEVLDLLKGFGIDVLFIPAGCTGVKQLHDLAFNKLFKKLYQELY